MTQTLTERFGPGRVRVGLLVAHVASAISIGGIGMVLVDHLPPTIPGPVPDVFWKTLFAVSLILVVLGLGIVSDHYMRQLGEMERS